MNERTEKLEVIFHTASELSTPEQRESYLSEVCAEDPDWRREVETLLGAVPAGDDHPRAARTNLVELSWPNTSGFTLQRAHHLAPGAVWTSASIISTGLTNGIRSAVVTLAPTNRFFRLYKP